MNEIYDVGNADPIKKKSADGDQPGDARDHSTTYQKEQTMTNLDFTALPYRLAMTGLRTEIFIPRDDPDYEVFSTRGALFILDDAGDKSGPVPDEVHAFLRHAPIGTKVTRFGVTWTNDGHFRPKTIDSAGVLLELFMGQRVACGEHTWCIGHHLCDILDESVPNDERHVHGRDVRHGYVSVSVPVVGEADDIVDTDVCLDPDDIEMVPGESIYDWQIRLKRVIEEMADDAERVSEDIVRQIEAAAEVRS